MKLITRLFLGLMLITVGQLQGQNKVEALIEQQKDELQSIFIHAHGNMTHLISGRQHIAWYPSIDGNPFWFTDNWLLGNLQTHQYFYQNIPMKYDAHLDALVYLPDSFSTRRIWVNPELVNYFFLYGKTFVYLGRGPEKEAMEAANMEPGYYEMMYSGKTQFIIKRLKYIKSVQSHSQVLGEFTEKNYRYIIRNDQFYYIKTKKHLLRALNDQAEGIKAWLKKSKIKFRLVTDNQLVNLMNYYDSL